MSHDPHFQKLQVALEHEENLVVEGQGHSNQIKTGFILILEWD